MKVVSRHARGRVLVLRATSTARTTDRPRALPGSISNACREMPLRAASAHWGARAAGARWWQRGSAGSPRGDQWDVYGVADPRSVLATQGRGRRLSAMRICNAPGCTQRAARPCFDCGAWRCEEHLLAAVHHRKSAVVHLCPNCLHAHVNAPDRLRLDGVEDARAERAADPLAPLETRRDRITAVENNVFSGTLASEIGTRAWRLERGVAAKRPAKRTSAHVARLLDR